MSAGGLFQPPSDFLCGKRLAMLTFAVPSLNSSIMLKVGCWQTPKPLSFSHLLPLLKPGNLFAVVVLYCSLYDCADVTG